MSAVGHLALIQAGGLPAIAVLGSDPHSFGAVQVARIDLLASRRCVRPSKKNFVPSAYVYSTEYVSKFWST